MPTKKEGNKKQADEEEDAQQSLPPPARKSKEDSDNDATGESQETQEQPKHPTNNKKKKKKKMKQVRTSNSSIASSKSRLANPSLNAAGAGAGAGAVNQAASVSGQQQQRQQSVSASGPTEDEFEVNPRSSYRDDRQSRDSQMTDDLSTVSGLTYDENTPGAFRQPGTNTNLRNSREGGLEAPSATVYESSEPQVTPVAAQLVEDQDDLEARLRMEMEERFQHIARLASTGGHNPSIVDPSVSSFSPLPSAEVVRAEAVPSPDSAASVPKGDSQESSSKNMKLWIIGGCILLLVIVGATVGTTLALAGGGSGDPDPEDSRGVVTEAPTQTPAPTMVPLPPLDPDIDPNDPEEVERFISQLQQAFSQISGAEAVNDLSSPQYRAIAFISENAAPFLSEKSDEQIVEAYIIIVFYFAVGGEEWWDQNNFFTTPNVCDYHTEFDGVFCDNGGRVNRISFDENNLVGTIATEIGFLIELEALILVNNEELRGDIPDSFVGLQSLTDLLLYNNNLEGTIPERLRFLRNLQSIDLSTNLLTGTIPSIALLQREIQRINFSGNEALFGDITALWNALPRDLKEFSCAGCDFSNSQGDPEWDRFNLLEVLDLSYAEINGLIPEALGQLSLLREARASNNNLHGTIPTGFARLQNLEEFDFFNNELTGEVPLMQSPVLRLFDVENNQLGGNLEEILLSLPASNLQFIWLSNNDITGTIPSQLGLYSNLEIFVVPYTSLIGSIPQSVRSLSSLRYFAVEGNSLTGTIPDGFTQTPLETLQLHENDFVDDLDDPFCIGGRDYYLTADCPLDSSSFEPAAPVTCACCVCFDTQQGELEGAPPNKYI